MNAPEDYEWLQGMNANKNEAYTACLEGVNSPGHARYNVYKHKNIQRFFQSAVSLFFFSATL